MKRFFLLLSFASMFAAGNSYAQCDAYTFIATGSAHTMAIKSDGTLWGWGNNEEGQLGDGTNINKNTPVPIAAASTWKAVYPGDLFTLAIKSDGTLWAWGYNEGGQLGNGTNENENTPVPIAPANTWKALSVGYDHTLAIKSDGTLWTWGYNDDGQLGDGTYDSRNLPVLIASGTWKAVFAGGYHSFAIKSDGTLWAWGYNGSGQLGDGTNQNKNTPVQIGLASDWEMIAAAVDYTVALKSDGSLWTWGFNGFGQLGDGTYTNRSFPQAISAGNTWRSVSAGLDHTHAIRSDGTLWACGRNIKGQLGDGSNTDRSALVQIASTIKWSSISSGLEYTIALNSSGAFYTWGDNEYGQLGSGTNANTNAPEAIHTPDYNSGLASGGSSYTSVNTPDYAILNSSCNPIAAVQLAGSTSTVSAKVWVAASQPEQYVKRHYEITPGENPATTSGWVTLYFTNQDFKDFNSQSPALLLPDADDPATVTARKANLLIEKRSGASNDGSGAPDTYTGTVQNIDPDDANIVWDTEAGRWEVTFEVTGFSGFFAKTQTQALPVTFGDITAFFKNGQLVVNWSTLTEQHNHHFEIEGSADGTTFYKIATVNSKAIDGNSSTELEYDYTGSLSDALSVFGISLVVMTLGMGWKRNKKQRYLLLIPVALAFTFFACNKNEIPLKSETGKALFIRIAQVDIDGKKTYSKTVQVINRQ